jgi:hypothetical protein
MPRLSSFMVGTIVCGAGSLGVFLSSCNFKKTAPQNVSRLDYLTMGGIQACTLRYAREPAVRICIYGGAAGGKSLETAQSHSKRALLKWFRALRQIDDKVTDQVVFSCDKPHLKIQLEPGSGTSMGRCGYALIYSQRPYGTYLHEFGHAVAGLADTYSGGSAGNCISGQPQSIMCWGAYGPDDAAGYNRLFPDDVKGIQAQYRRIMGNMQAPAQGAIDPFAPLDPEAPWSNHTFATDELRQSSEGVGR